MLDHLWDRSYVTRVPSQKRSSMTRPYLRGSHYRQILFLPRLPDSFFTFHLISHHLILILSTFPHCNIRVSRRFAKSPRHHAIKPSSPQAIVSEYDRYAYGSYFTNRVQSFILLSSVCFLFAVVNLLCSTQVQDTCGLRCFNCLLAVGSWIQSYCQLCDSLETPEMAKISR